MLESAPRLSAVVTPSIGVETVDVEAASDLGILVANGAVPENHVSMAEASVMLMLNLFYGLRTTEEALRKNEPRPPPEMLHAEMLMGKTVGIIGFGQIGREVARRLEPFGVHMLAHSPHADPATMPSTVTLTDLNTVMRRSDIVGVFVAVTPANRGLINETTLGLMKPTAYLLNVARGSAIDEPALIRALQQRRIRGAALDTFAVEPLPTNSPLRELDNVILTGHAVGHTREGIAALKAAAEENLRRLISGSLPLHCKNPEIEPRWVRRIRSMSDKYQTPAALDRASFQPT
jgi:D-3-phosphoglycerate dehydrogenase